MSSTPLLRPIPGTVVDQALWYMSGKIPVSREIPCHRVSLLRTWQHRANLRGHRVRATAGDAIRWSLYAWRSDWDEPSLAEAIVAMTRKLDARLTPPAPPDLDAKAYNLAFNKLALANRRRLAGADALERTRAYLAANRPPEEPGSEIRREIWTRVNAVRHPKPAPVVIDGKVWSSRAAYDRSVALEVEKLQRKEEAFARLKAVFGDKVSRKPGPRQAKSFTGITGDAITGRRKLDAMGHLARIAAEMGARVV